MNRYNLMLSQNGWEYTGNIFVECNEIIREDEKTLILDGIRIEFDEEIEIEGEINDQ